MLEQSSNLFEKEVNEEMMNVQEVARLIEWLRTVGMSDADINNCVTYIATGVGLPVKEQDEKESD